MYHLNLEQIITFELGSEHKSVNMLKSVFHISKFVKKNISIYLSIYLSTYLSMCHCVVY